MIDPDHKIKAFEYIDRYYEVLNYFHIRKSVVIVFASILYDHVDTQI